MPKETSEEVASLAAIWVDCTGQDLVTFYEDDPDGLNDLAKIIRTLAASCLSQAEPNADD